MHSINAPQFLSYRAKYSTYLSSKSFSIKMSVSGSMCWVNLVMWIGWGDVGILAVNALCWSRRKKITLRMFYLEKEKLQLMQLRLHKKLFLTL